MSAVERAAFIDRDGVINVDHGYVHRIDQFQLLPGVPSALRRLHDAGLRLIVVTNQSGIARGLYDEADFFSLTQHLQDLLDGHGVRFDAVYHCPHLPDASVPAYRRDCDCRKPAPGMLLRGIAEFGIDPARSVLFGDKTTDIQAGRAARIGWCCLIGHETASAAGADAVAPDLASAVDAWLALP
jgi:D-glycero-D-manno-heptose 1,7-bisphosphate phosphatase